MGKQEVINYVMNTPHNTNPAILKQMLDEVDGGNDFIVKLIQTESPRVADKSFNEILNALQSGKNVYAYFETDPDGGRSVAVEYDNRPDRIYFTFIGAVVQEHKLDSYYFTTAVVEYDGTWFSDSFYVKGEA